MSNLRASAFTLFYSWSCSLIAAVLLFLPACGGKGEQKSLPVPEVSTVKPTVQTVTEYLDFTGNTQATSAVQLEARIPGFLTKVNFKDGDWVKEGDILFEIEPDSYAAKLQLAEAAVAASQAELLRASSEYNRQLDLVKQKAVAVADVEKWKAQRDGAQAAVSQAEASLALAKIQYSYTQVRAPFDGRVDRRLKDPGNLVGVSGPTLLTTIYNMEPIYAYFSINEKDLVRVRRTEQQVGEKIPVAGAIEGESGYPHQGYIDFGSTSLDAGTGTMLLRGVFENPRTALVLPKILPGMFMRLRVPVGERPQAVLVPEKAVGMDQGGRYVLVVDAQNTVNKMPVKGGTLIDGLLLIDEGLKGDEAVIVNGLQQARPGTKVKAIPEDRNSAVSK